MELANIIDTLDLLEDLNQNPEPKIGSRFSDKKGATIIERIENCLINVHASGMAGFMAGNFGLSDREKKTMFDLMSRTKPMTDNQAETYEKLLVKKANPDIGLTAKSALKKMFAEDIYQQKQDSSSKYTSHGNYNEVHSIDMMNEVLSKNWKKNEKTETSQELMLTGTPDVVLDTAVIDIKNPFDCVTFDRNRELSEEEKNDYFWQGQAYMELFDKDVFYLVYTLNENYFMEGTEYEHLSPLDRIVIKRFDRDREAIERYRERIPAIKRHIEHLREQRLLALHDTGELLNELKTL